MCLWPIGLLLVAILLLSVHRPKSAAVFVAFSIYFAACKTVPSLLNRTTVVLIRRSKYRQAEDVARFGIAWCKVLNIGPIGKLSRSLAWDSILKSQLAQALLQQARYDEAVKINEGLLELYEAEQDIDGAAAVRGKMAFCYTQLGEFSKAEGLLSKSVVLLEAAVRSAENTNDKKTTLYRARLCGALFEQATFLETKRKFEAAETVRRKAVEVSRQLSEGEEDLRLMPHYSMLGKLLIRLGQYDEAEKLLNKVLAVRVKALPPTSVLIASGKQGLGRLYCAVDRLDVAQPYLVEALSSAEKTVGVNHPDIPSYKDDLAKLMIKQSKYQQAETLILSAIEQKERQSGKNHPDLIDYLLDLSELKRITGNISEAESASQRADQILAVIN